MTHQGACQACLQQARLQQARLQQARLQQAREVPDTTFLNRTIVVVVVVVVVVIGRSSSSYESGMLPDRTIERVHGSKISEKKRPEKPGGGELLHCFCCLVEYSNTANTIAE